MIRVPRPALAALLAALTPLPALAQVPGSLPPSGTIGGEEQKPSGAAEKAPKEPGQLPTTPVLPPWPGQKRKKLELFQLDGYFRVRTYWFDNFNLGFHDVEGTGNVPFREPATCLPGSGVPSACDGSLGSADMRLRLDPVINVSEDVSVHAQIDMLDNVILGSTPAGLLLNGVSPPANIPVVAFSPGQVAPDDERNFIYDSVRVNRAWAEVMTPLGLLRFGRMPSTWGLGVLANSGGYNPFTGDYCLDCDYSYSADRVIFSSKIPGTPFKAAIGYDWASTGPTSMQTGIWSNRYQGYGFDLDDSDDLSQWVFVLGRLDTPEEWKESVDSGDLALNYGAYFLYRSQDTDATNWTLGSNTVETTYVRRGAKAYIPDVYFRLGWGKLEVAAEAVAVLGTIDDLSDVLPGLIDQDIRQFGGVARGRYLFLDDSLEIGLEVGFATGDQWDASPQGALNYHDVPVIPGDTFDHTITNFHFSPNFIVDKILFRRLIGTVTNATFVKPTFRYDLTDRIRFNAAAIMSFANEPVATPGNGSVYGIELDGDLGYHNLDEGFFAGLSYGVLFPMGALSHPSDAEFGYPAGNTGDPGTAQIFQMRLAVMF